MRLYYEVVQQAAGERTNDKLLSHKGGDLTALLQRITARTTVVARLVVVQVDRGIDQLCWRARHNETLSIGVARRFGG